MNRGFNTAISGLSAARIGLSVTGHNMANTGTVGYVRQQALQHDFAYQGIGNNLRVGLGNDITIIRQIRDKFLDKEYRTEIGRATFHATIYQTGNILEDIYGELESQYSTQTITQDLWDAINELTMHPSGRETRNNFMSTIEAYLTKMNNIQERMVNEQHNLNNSIKETVTRINQLTTRIDQLNGKISLAEISGQQANDYRDERNLCLDELSSLIKIEYSENARGEVRVTTGGIELVANGFVQRIGLRYTGPHSSFVEPVFTDSRTILDFDPTYQNARAVFNYSQIGATYGNDSGELFGMIVARGLYPTNYQSMNAYDFAGKVLNNISLNLPAFLTPSNPLAPAWPTFPTLAWPNHANPVLFPLGVDDPAYIAAYQAYLDEINDYVNDVEQYLKDNGPDGAGLLTDAEYGAALQDLLDFKQNVDPTATTPTSLAELNFQFNTFVMYKDCQYIDFNATECTITKTMREIDLVFNYVVELVNSTLVGIDLDGYRGLPIFTEIIPGKGLTMGNVEINPRLREADGHNKIGLKDSVSSGIDDGTKAIELLKLWKEANDIFEAVDGAHQMSIEDAYSYVVNNLAVVTNKALSFYDAQVGLVSEIDNKRLQISGVSLDEELKNMMLYQHAFNAASRIITVIDSMIDKVVNGTGRVGL